MWTNVCRNSVFDRKSSFIRDYFYYSLILIKHFVYKISENRLKKKVICMTTKIHTTEGLKLANVWHFLLEIWLLNDIQNSCRFIFYCSPNRLIVSDPCNMARDVTLIRFILLSENLQQNWTRHSEMQYICSDHFKQKYASLKFYSHLCVFWINYCFPQGVQNMMHNCPHCNFK